mmetsp:Transcript_28679/g.58664  ORF Transcript_28679/g.58664 Transcript_28679/m.58664 type:complete len:176 (-) Transcript_28679:102-629(-)|eukprot:CAMPEP_0181318696 /NCGR_PEP_ID=MMETSP1101-20121128/17147_1 /TAXON_ID=46948 /ORGANISM="Rhodomonas abbreviata, Strain Caron Lab Isolate" /LENGTH=175 /DNA_ID=CAMNT_0023426189 /DNA_START=112 /DNA_END=639 /DNA_ORIENTATION=-
MCHFCPRQIPVVEPSAPVMNKRALEVESVEVEAEPERKIQKTTDEPSLFEKAEKAYRGRLLNTAILFLQLQEQVRTSVAKRHERDENERKISLQIAESFPLQDVKSDEDKETSRNVQDESLELDLKSSMSPSEEAATGIAFVGKEQGKALLKKGSKDSLIGERLRFESETACVSA